MPREAFLVDSPRSSALRALNYTPTVERFRRGSRSINNVRLGELLAEVGPAYGSVFVRRDCEREHGIELLSQGDMFGTEPSGRVIRRDSMPRPERHLVKRWQILIAGAGTLGENELFGRVLIADERLVRKYVGPDAVSLTFREPGSVRSLYTYALLMTPEGLRAIRSCAYGTKVLRLRRDMLVDIPIPFPEERVENAIARLVEKAVLARERFAASLRAARAPLEALPEMLDAAAQARSTGPRSVIWGGPLPTLTGWTYASTGGALKHLREQWPQRLRDVAKPNGVFNGLRFARIPCKAPHGVELLSQRDVFLIRPIGRRIKQPPVPDTSLFAPTTALLLASHGQFSDGSLFGKVELAANGFTSKAITQDILRVLPHEEKASVCYAFLSTDVGRMLLKSTAVGTSVPIMRPDLILDLPFPSIDPRMSDLIGHHVAEGVQARAAAERYESEAASLVREEVLARWLA